MPLTYAQQLESVQAAIIEAEQAQAWEQGDRSETRGRLEVLYGREERLRKLVEREKRGGARVRRAVYL